jgi:hypothetical protein
MAVNPAGRIKNPVEELEGRRVERKKTGFIGIII